MEMNNEDEDAGKSFLNTNYTVLAVTITGSSLIFAVVSCWLHEVCYNRCGIEICTGSIAAERRREIRRYQLRAIQLQRQMERDLLDSSAAKQEERRQVYGEFLQKFSKVRCRFRGVRMFGMFHIKHLTSRIVHTIRPPQVLREEDIEVEDVADESKETVEPTRKLRLSFSNACNEHDVEATCIICFRDYEAGDRLVWSTSTETCRHVYHMECMLKWLSTGQKKCPMCRGWFVPEGHLDRPLEDIERGNNQSNGDQRGAAASTDAGQAMD